MTAAASLVNHAHRNRGLKIDRYHMEVHMASAASERLLLFTYGTS